MREACKEQDTGMTTNLGFIELYGLTKSIIACMILMFGSSSKGMEGRSRQ